MRFLADQDVWQVTLDLLMDWNHDVVTAKQIGMDRASDEDLLIQAEKDNRLFITRDIFDHKKSTNGIKMTL